MTIEGSVPVPAGNDAVRRVIGPLAEAKGWMKLVAVVTIGEGVLVALTIVGIVVAWLPIWVGVLLWQAAGSAELSAQSGDEAEATRAISRLRTLFTVAGVMVLISLVLWVVIVVFVIVAGVVGSVSSAFLPASLI